MPIHQLSVSGFPAVALKGGEVEIVVVPSLGMKVTNLRRARGREWLWRSDQIPLAAPKPGASYVETADSGGWDECFPTVGPSPVPGNPAAAMLPDHGELWSAEWESVLLEGKGGPMLSARVAGTLGQYLFQRDVTVDAHEPVVRFRYALRHTGTAPFPWIWSSHPLLNVQPGTTLELPTATQVKVDAVHGRNDFEVDDIVAWPIADGTDAPRRFTFPDPSAGWATKLFADVGPSGRAVLTDPRRGERLETRADPAQVPQVGLWINCGGWAPAGRTPYYNLALEPCIGAPDRLDRAAEWGLMQTLEPGEERVWEVEVWLLEEGEAGA